MRVTIFNVEGENKTLSYAYVNGGEAVSRYWFIALLKALKAYLKNLLRKKATNARYCVVEKTKLQKAIRRLRTNLKREREQKELFAKLEESSWRLYKLKQNSKEVKPCGKNLSN